MGVARGQWAKTSGCSSWFLLSWFIMWLLSSASASTVASSSLTSIAAGALWPPTGATRKLPLCWLVQRWFLQLAGCHITHLSLSMLCPLMSAQQLLPLADSGVSYRQLCLHQICHSPRLGQVRKPRQGCPCCGRWCPWRPFCWCVWLLAGTRRSTFCCRAQPCVSSELYCLPSFISTWGKNLRSAGVLLLLLPHACHTLSLLHTRLLTKPWHTGWLSKVSTHTTVLTTHYSYLPSQETLYIQMSHNTLCVHTIVFVLMLMWS